MKIWNVLLRLAGLFLLMLGSLLAIRDGFMIEWWQLKDLIMICGLVSVFVTLIFSHWISGLCGVAVSGLGAAFLVWHYGEELMLEWQHLYDTAIPLINQYHHLEISTLSGQWSQTEYDSRFFLLLAALIIGLWIGADLLWKKTRFLAFLLAACAFFSGMCVGNAPGIWAVICLVCGLGFSLAVPVKGATAVQWKASVLTLMGLFLALCVMLVAYQPISQVFLKNHDLYLKRQIELEDQLLELTSGGEFLSWLRWNFGGNEDHATLSMEPPRQGDGVVFEMTVEKLPNTPLYVKDFTSVRYEDGTWYAEDGEMLFGYLAEHGFATGDDLNSEQEQRMQKAAAEEITSTFRQMKTFQEPQKIIMDIKERQGSTTLWPYYCDVPEGAQCVGDAGIRTDSRRYETFGYPMGVNVIGYDFTGYPSGDYSGYLYRFLEEQAMTAREILGDDLQAAENALEKCVYSFDLEPAPEGTDLVADFLFRQKKGYCMHFASANTLLCQSYHIPARYASGYIVLPGDFRKNADGTYTAAVPEYRGHAWLEIYQEEFGWYPVEVTPPSYFEALETAGVSTPPGEALDALYAENSPEEVPKEIEKPEEIEEPSQNEPEPEVEEEPEGTSPEEPESSEDQKEESTSHGTNGQDTSSDESGRIWSHLWPILAWTLGTIAVLAALVSLILVRVRWIWKRREAAFQNTDTNQAAQAIFSAILGLLRFYKIRIQPQEDELAFARRVEESLTWMKPGAFVDVMEILRIARFGNNPIRETQRSGLLSMYEQIMAQSVSQMSQKTLLWYRYFHVKLRI